MARVLVVVVALTAAAGVAQARPRHGDHPQPRHHRAPLHDRHVVKRPRRGARPSARPARGAMPMPAATPAPQQQPQQPAVPAAAAPSAPTVSGASTPPPAPARLQVVARDFSLSLSRPSVPAGPVKIEFDDDGQDPHALNLRTAAGDVLLQSGVVQPGDRTTLTTTLGAGTYTLYCPMPGHEQMGMEVTLTVQAAA